MANWNNIFDFLGRLQKNNNREWFEEHKPEFKELQKQFKQWVSSLEATLNELDRIERAKIFRIYRDVRFSKDKTPYKTHFSSILSREGASRRGSYYVHFEPNQSFVALGFYAPEKDDLLRIRKEWEADDSQIRTILADKNFQHHFPDGLQGDQVKTVPRGFDKHHPALDLIRNKQFYFSTQLTNQEVLHDDLIPRISAAFQSGMPYLDYMSEVVTTNLNGESII